MTPSERDLSVASLVAQVVDYAIIALDVHGTIQSWNAGAEALKGYTAEQAIGQHFSMFYTEEDREVDLPAALLARAAEQGSVAQTGWRVRRDGSRFWADIVLTAIHDDEDESLTGFAKVTRDLTSQHELQTALEASEERFRLLVSQVVDYAIIALDPDGVIESWNAGAERLKGYPESEALGKHFSMFYPEADRASGLPGRLLATARHNGRVEHTGWRVRRDGTRFWGDVILTALFDTDGVLRGYAKVTRDLTQLKRLEEAQDSFYAAFEHDLRTPITAIKGFSQLLREDVTAAQRDTMLARLDHNVDRLLAMTGELIEYARLRSGRLPLQRERLSLIEVASATVDTLAGTVDRSRVRVSGECADIVGDRVCVERIVANLVVNAAKYSPQDRDIEVRCSPGRSGYSRLVVQDRGRGIAPEDAPHIFNEFERGRFAESDGGTGLGLSSVRALVDVLGGGIELDSEVGVGTTVSVDLPTADDGMAQVGVRSTV